MDISWHKRDANYEKVLRFANEAFEQGIDLFILPEMFSTGFSMETSITAEPLDGRTPGFLRNLARSGNVNVVGGFALKRADGKPQNVSLAVDRKGRDYALYAKVHLISLLEEDEYYEPGNEAVVFEMEGIKASCFVCFDLRFPEIFRSVADRCGVIMVIASWPESRQNHWDVLLRARAIENQCFIVGVNRVGSGGGLNFKGGTAIIDPTGDLIAEGSDKEGLVSAEIDLDEVQRIRTSMPFLKGRKRDLF
jgi:predicted amidohydrolase